MQNNTGSDDELSQMIAGLRQKQAAAAQDPTIAQSAPAMVPGSKTIEPLAGDMPMVAPQPVNDQPAANQPVIDQPVVHDQVPAASIDQQSLSVIKQQAIVELRPLVDRLNLAPEDKFDIILLLIRTTDDSSLIPLAHAEAARMTDEVRRAQALLDIIKEIDFFGRNGK